MTAIKKVAIIGAGTMGRRIAYGCVIKGVTVRLFDTEPAALQSAVPAVRRLIEERIATGRLAPGLTDAAMPLITVCRSIEEAMQGIDLAIETVRERRGQAGGVR